MVVTERTVTSNNVSACVALLSKSVYVKVTSPPASERRENNFKCFTDFNLKVKARIRP
jgi:hypothetical protein